MSDAMISELIRRLSKLEANFDNLIKPEMPLSRSLRPEFSAFVSTNIANVTGDGTTYGVVCDNEILDVGGNYNPATGIYTATYAGRHVFIGNILASGCGVAHNGGWINIATSAATFTSGYVNPGVAAFGGYYHFSVIALANMSVGNTAAVNIHVEGGTKVVSVWGYDTYSYFQGFLVD